MARVKKLQVAAKNGCDSRSMTKNFNNSNSGEFLLISSEAGMRTQIDLNCCY